MPDVVIYNTSPLLYLHRQHAMLQYVHREVGSPHEQDTHLDHNDVVPGHTG